MLGYHLVGWHLSILHGYSLLAQEPCGHMWWVDVCLWSTCTMYPPCPDFLVIDLTVWARMSHWYRQLHRLLDYINAGHSTKEIMKPFVKVSIQWGMANSYVDYLRAVEILYPHQKYMRKPRKTCSCTLTVMKRQFDTTTKVITWKIKQRNPELL